MILGTGIDIIEVARVEQMIQARGDAFLKKVCRPDEIRYCQRVGDPGRRFAGRLAAKESVAKALGTGWQDGLWWTDVEVLVDEKGAPQVTLHGAAARRAELLGAKRVFLTISHSENYAVAQAIVEAETSPG